jgi:AmmeMemoRadiSam system radical SAM enzyme/AmmeMemoRadiSam system protein B/AmmeMemoRadiSam system protein A
VSNSTIADGIYPGRWWHHDHASGRIVCDLCPRECRLKSGDRGFCFVRENRAGEMALSTYGKSTGFCIDPIEKKPLNHFFPGTSVLSFGTAGCNLGCKFCQNWEISKSREVEQLSQHAGPDAIAAAAVELGCRSVAFTYNDPVIWAEYAIDTAKACRERSVKSVAVTAGYIMPEARRDFYQWMDAANVDLKGFSEDFYTKITGSHLQPVLDTLCYLKHETEVWFEITNLVIPQANDDLDDLKAMSEWIVENLGPEVPVHFSAFHPDFRMRDRPNTPIETLIAAYDIASKAGILYPFIGNVHDNFRQSTYCPECRRRLIERDWYALGEYRIHDGICEFCLSPIAGRFENKPGDWGRKRLPVDMRRWEPTTYTSSLKEAKKMTASPVMELPQLLNAKLLTNENKQALIDATALLIGNFAAERTPPANALKPLEDIAKRNVFGVFTTLKRGSTLRGCCGSIGAMRPLGEQLLHACRRTALDDVRMPPISPYELPYLSLDISLLEELEPISQQGKDRLTSFEIGRHGLVVQHRDKSGLLLPSVPVEQDWDAEQFLRGICRKAGLPEDAWLEPDVKLQRFAGTSIHGGFSPEIVSSLPRAKPAVTTPRGLNQLQQWVVGNLSALARGATPTYFHPEVPDGTVNGLIVSLYTEVEKQPLLHLIRLAIRPGIPLQSSLFEMTQAAFEALKSWKNRSDTRIEIAVTVMNDPASHGTLRLGKELAQEAGFLESVRNAIGLEGLSDSSRAIIATTGPTAVMVSFDPESAPAFQLLNAAKSIGFHGDVMNVYSMAKMSTRPSFIASNLVLPKPDSEDRTPAVAGGFYPANDDERRMVVRVIVDGVADRPRVVQEGERLLAIMTPHAGLKFSGKVAALAWREVNFPRSLIVIGPKHTSEGVAWAIAPCRRWQLSDKVEFESDSELVKKLADGIAGLQRDSAAHRLEHGIEIQLPFLEYFSPHSRLAGLAIHGASWPRLQMVAKQLAEIIRCEAEPPLLVISSDMNHFAPEAENRRRDRVALDAILARDPQRLLAVCQEQQISMCGVIPAAWVMLTLSELDPNYQVRELGYATSYEVMPSDRVVGYSSLAFVSPRD